MLKKLKKGLKKAAKVAVPVGAALLAARALKKRNARNAMMNSATSNDGFAAYHYYDYHFSGMKSGTLFCLLGYKHFLYKHAQAYISTESDKSLKSKRALYFVFLFSA